MSDTPRAAKIRDIEQLSLQAFASIRAVRLFLRARAVINFNNNNNNNNNNNKHKNSIHNLKNNLLTYIEIEIIDNKNSKFYKITNFMMQRVFKIIQSNYTNDG